MASHQDHQPSTTDPFSLCLLYYDKYRCAKLREASFFSEVLRAYRKKPSVMLEKLKKKYLYDIPESVSITQLQRLISVYSVPQEYVDVIKSRLDKEAMAAFEAAEKYDETLDVHSVNFDAEKAFKTAYGRTKIKTLYSDNSQELNKAAEDLARRVNGVKAATREEASNPN